MATTHAPGAAGNAAQVDYWNARAGETWTALQEALDALFAPLTRAALAAADPRPGEQVVDVGCGCGATILELAARVGPAGRVTGLDVSEPMAARARARIAAAGLSNAEVVVADASAHAFASPPVDLLFSRFGVMFFADPVAAFRHLRAATAPGGRLLFAAWRALAANPWFAVPLAAGAPLLPPEPPGDPQAPGPLAFADDGRVRTLLAQAGWSEIAITPTDAPMRFGAPGEVEAATDLALKVGPLARRLAEADADTRARVRAAVLAALARHDGPEGVVLGGAVWLVSARA
jgi:SAM-dependent methyltransferase